MIVDTRLSLFNDVTASGEASSKRLPAPRRFSPNASARGCVTEIR